jgi:hypothetical protein
MGWQYTRAAGAHTLLREEGIKVQQEQRFLHQASLVPRFTLENIRQLHGCPRDNATRQQFDPTRVIIHCHDGVRMRHDYACRARDARVFCTSSSPYTPFSYFPFLSNPFSSLWQWRIEGSDFLAKIWAFVQYINGLRRVNNVHIRTGTGVAILNAFVSPTTLFWTPVVLFLLSINTYSIVIRRIKLLLVFPFFFFSLTHSIWMQILRNFQRCTDRSWC